MNSSACPFSFLYENTSWAGGHSEATVPPREGSRSLIKNAANTSIFPASQLLHSHGYLAAEKRLGSTGRAMEHYHRLVMWQCLIWRFVWRSPTAPQLYPALTVMADMQESLKWGGTWQEVQSPPPLYLSSLDTVHHSSARSFAVSPFPLHFTFDFISSVHPLREEAQRWWPWRDESSFCFSPLSSIFSLSASMPLPPHLAVSSQGGQRDEISGV